MPRKYCLGKKPPLSDSRTLLFERYVEAPALPPLPVRIDYGEAVSHWPLYANDRYADCTCAAAGHMIQAWRTTTGASPRKPTTEDVVAFYARFTTPGPENAVEVLRVLRNWRSQGFAGDRIGAFAALRLGEMEQVKQSIHLFGGCYIGIVLPGFVMSAGDPSRPRWSLRSEGLRGAGAPDPSGGHAVSAFAYDAGHLYVVTWGAVKAMSWEFYCAYADEAYAILSADWFSHGRTPSGFDLQQLRADLDAL